MRHLKTNSKSQRSYLQLRDRNNKLLRIICRRERTIYNNRARKEKKSREMQSISCFKSKKTRGFMSKIKWSRFMQSSQGELYLRARGNSICKVLRRLRSLDLQRTWQSNSERRGSRRLRKSWLRRSTYSSSSRESQSKRFC